MNTRHILTKLGAPVLSLVAALALYAQERGSCPLQGSYQINVEASDKLYSVVRGATGRVPFGDQQRFFIDLSTRLTPPDLIAVECHGKEVSIGSSRAPRVTFLADGKTRREPRPGGTYVNSRVVMNAGTLTLTSDGKAEDNVNVSFEALDNGRQMRVVRRISAEQLDEPIVITTIYDKLSDSADWRQLGDARTPAQAAPRNHSRNHPDTTTGDGDIAALRKELDEWIEATDRKDIDKQMTFYLPQLQAYYLTRNTPRDRVLEEKRRVFANARSVQIRADEPEIVLQDGGRIAVMRFHKAYRVEERSHTKTGEVIQELRWQKTSAGWRIFSERDVRVIR